ncbi:hypothetical protein MVEN_00723100 [Mycena venus]|uniref:Uncharacterized protein n=1 Tax=Mycena venus TaxID=2733690 RepID=A0A8H6YJY3_9AGAR|nr:hypothetical protein MVEN_00723100 [Mycena venus]
MLHPSINDPATFKCPKLGCGRLLKLKLAKKGGQKDRNYLCCDSEHFDNKIYWYFFPRGVRPAPQTAAAPISVPPPQLQPATTSVVLCAGQPCPKRPNQFCDNHMCRSHCLADPATCRQHRPNQPPPASKPPLPALTSPVLAALNAISAETLRTITFAPQSAATSPRPSCPSHPSAFPLDDDDEQDEDLKLAIALSLKPSSLYLSPASSSSAVMPDITHRIDLVYWAINGGPAVICAIDSCPTWPHSWPRFRLSDVAHLLVTDDETTCQDFYECYSTKYDAWMKIRIDYIHQVSTDQSLLIRRVGVVGKDEKQHIDLLKRPSSPVVARPVLCDTKGKGKAKREVIEILDSDDDDDEEVRVVRHIKVEPSSPLRPVKRPCLTISIPRSSSPSFPSLSSSILTAPTSPALDSPVDYFPPSISLAKRK